MKRTIEILAVWAALCLLPAVLWAADRGALYSGQTLTYPIEAPTYQDVYQINGAAGDRVLVNATPTSGTLDTSIALYSQSGVLEAETTTAHFDWQLQGAGAYTLVIADDDLADPGVYNISFLQLPNGPLNFTGDPDGRMVNPGETWSGSIGAASDLDAYQFVGQAGDQVRFSGVTTSGTLEPTFALYSQTGVKETESTLGQLDWQLQSSGLYSLVITDSTYDKTGAYSVSFHNISQVTNNDGAFDVAPQVLDDGRILWQGWDGHDYEIYSLMPGQSITQHTNNTTPDVMPQMNASGQLVWMNWDGSDWEVWYNFGSGPRQLTSNSGAYDVLPQITADAKIYWQGWDGNDYEIYRYYEIQLPNSTIRVTDQLTQNSLPDASPQVNSTGQLTWMQWDGSGWQVYYDLGSGPVQLTTGGNNIWPQITNDSQIFWQGWDGQDYEIYRYNTGNGAFEQLTNNTTDDMTPAIKNGVLVWSQWDGHDWEIYRYVLSTGLITPITDDEEDDLHPRLNTSGQIVWMKWDGVDYEIYSYK